jgi:protein-S-isoprenylcysteine O-methyltransferase Ste14
MLQGTMPIVFLIVWILDSFFLHISTFLSEDIGIVIRITLAIPFPLLAYFLMNRSHKMVFGEHAELIDTGIYGRLRHPMYLGSLMIYVFFILLTLSILAFLIWVAIFLVYDRLAAYEERILLEDLGEEYAGYMKHVHRWVPI